jgi:hypothetical protein
LFDFSRFAFLYSSHLRCLACIKTFSSGSEMPPAVGDVRLVVAVDQAVCEAIHSTVGDRLGHDQGAWVAEQAGGREPFSDPFLARWRPC